MREKFVKAFQSNVDKFGVEGTLKTFPKGPPQIMDMLIRQGRKMDPPMAKWIEANREEAEQIAAGILGLM